MGAGCGHARGLPAVGAIAGALVLTVMGDSTLAQRDDDGLDALDECSRILERDARLDCLDAVLAERGEPSARSASPPAPAPDPAPAPAVEPPAANSAAPATAGAAAATAAAATNAVSAAAPAEEPLSRRERRRRETQTVTIVEVQVNALGHSTFVTADEDRWLSVNTPEFGYPEPPFEVDIEPGSGGSSFLRLPNRNRRLRVDRVE